MDEAKDYQYRHTKIIVEKKELFKHALIPEMKENIHSFATGVSAIYQFFIENGLLQVDPYREGYQLKGLKIPTSERYTESHSLHEVSFRFSQYVSQWELLDNASLNLDDLTDNLLEKVCELLEYVQWKDFSVNSASQITQSVARILVRVIRSNNSIATKILTSWVEQLAEKTGTMHENCQELLVFLRESYKNYLRGSIIRKVDINQEDYQRKLPQILETIQDTLTESGLKIPFRQKFIEEILDEEHALNKTELQEKNLEMLRKSKFSKEKILSSKEKETQKNKALLYAILDRLAHLGEPIRAILLRMRENDNLILHRRKKFSEKLSQIFLAFFNRSHLEQGYSVSIKDPVTGTDQIEVIDFSHFFEITMRRSKSLLDLQNRNSLTSKRVREVEFDVLERYIKKALNGTKKIHKQLEALEIYFHSNAIPEEIKKNIKGCSFHLKGMRVLISEVLQELSKYHASSNKIDASA